MELAKKYEAQHQEITDKAQALKVWLDSWFPEAVKAYRERMGLTQEALGEQLGVTRSYICMVEKGRKHPSHQFVCGFLLLTASK